MFARRHYESAKTKRPPKRGPLESIRLVFRPRARRFVGNEQLRSAASNVMALEQQNPVPVDEVFTA
jgi:hypothetical protein